MKQLFLSIIATILFGHATHAQADVYAKSSMVVLVAQAQKDFIKGTSYQDWVAKQIGSETKPSQQAEKLLKEVYGFLSTQAKADVIYKVYNGNSLAELALFEKESGLNSTTNNDANRSWWWLLIHKIVLVYIELFIYMP